MFCCKPTSNKREAYFMREQKPRLKEKFSISKAKARLSDQKTKPNLLLHQESMSGLNTLKNMSTFYTQEGQRTTNKGLKKVKKSLIPTHQPKKKD